MKASCILVGRFLKVVRVDAALDTDGWICDAALLSMLCWLDATAAGEGGPAGERTWAVVALLPLLPLLPPLPPLPPLLLLLLLPPLPLPLLLGSFEAEGALRDSRRGKLY